MTGRQSAYDSGVLVERERCVRILREMWQAAEKRRQGHHATVWLQHAENAIQMGISPDDGDTSE